MDENIKNTENDATREMPPIKNSSAEDTTFIPIIDGSVPEPSEDKIPSPPPEEYDPPEEPEKEVKRSRKWVPVFISSAIAVIMCMSILTAYVIPIITEWGMARGMAKIITPLVNANEPPRNTNVLLVGTDRGGYRTDTMMVATYDNANNVVNVMQLPRDTYVSGNGRRDKKLNSAYFSGIDQLKYELELAYGIKIQKYLAVELDGFIEMVDELGGVEVYVPIDMDYDDPTPGQDLHIHLNEGLQVLSGEDAEGFVRFRKNNDGTGYPLGDIDRMAAQKDFIMAVIKKVISMDGISKIPELLEIAKDNIITDITTDEATAYVYKVLSLDSESIRFYEAAGEMAYQSGWYFFVDEEENEMMVNQYFNGDKNVAAIYSSKPASTRKPSQKTTTPKPEPEPEYDDIDDSERYTYYTTPEPEESAEAGATATPKTTASPDSSASPKATVTPKASASPDSSASPKATATSKPSATPKVTPSPESTSTPKADRTKEPEVEETPEADISDTEAESDEE